MIVLARRNGITGELNKITNVFTPRAWTKEESQRFCTKRGTQQIKTEKKKEDKNALVKINFIKHK